MSTYYVPLWEDQVLALVQKGQGDKHGHVFLELENKIGEVTGTIV